MNTLLMKRALSRIFVFDPWLLLILTLLAGIGMSTMYSAVNGTDGRFAEQLRNFGVALAAMWVVAPASPQLLMRLVGPTYLLGLLLLLGGEVAGDTRQGATRWLDLGFTAIQPSELMKIAMPMMLAWYFHRREGVLRIRDFVLAGVLLLLPFALIVPVSGLCTSLQVLAVGFVVYFFSTLAVYLLASHSYALCVFVCVSADC